MPAPAPNLLWIVTTQWRAAAAGYAGDPNARTPCLDAFAREAVDFAEAVTPHPFGPFARAALLTGVASPENGVRDYYDPLPAAAPTIAQALGLRGYATAFFGKWHLYRRDPAAPLVGPAHARILVPPGHRGGFACWEGFESGFLLNDPWLHGTRLPEPRQFPGYQADVLAARAADWIAAAPAPWFAVVSLESPHPPYDAPVPAGGARWDPAALALRPNVPRGGEVEERARRELAGYYAHLEATDRAIGALLARVPRAGTVVSVTSVHGDMHGAHGQFRKGWPHEESVRVPLLVRDARPGAPAGVRSRALVSLLELPRMTRAWADGAVVQPDWPAEAQRISMPSVVRLPHQCDRAWRGVRTATGKLVLGDDGEPWLGYDLARDPDETVNRAGDPAWADELAALRRRLGA